MMKVELRMEGDGRGRKALRTALSFASDTQRDMWGEDPMAESGGVLHDPCWLLLHEYYPSL